MGNVRERVFEKGDKGENVRKGRGGRECLGKKRSQRATRDRTFTMEYCEE